MAEDFQNPLSPQPDFPIISQCFQTLADQMAKVPNTPQFNTGNAILTQLQQMSLQIDTMSQQLNTRLDTMSQQLNTRLDTMSQQLNTRLDTISQQLNTRLDTVSLQLNAIDTRIEAR
jgi:DNA anti-recombination protein RmuC